MMAVVVEEADLLAAASRSAKRVIGGHLLRLILYSIYLQAIFNKPITMAEIREPTTEITISSIEFHATSWETPFSFKNIPAIMTVVYYTGNNANETVPGNSRV